MVNNTNNNIAREVNKLNETETQAVVNYISQLLSKRISRQTNLNNNLNNNADDDLIVSLSNALENKRARQVVEWERLRRQNLQRGA